MKICGNSVFYHNNLIGDLTGYPDPIRYSPKGIANILLLDMLERHLMVT